MNTTYTYTHPCTADTRAAPTAGENDESSQFLNTVDDVHHAVELLLLMAKTSVEAGSEAGVEQVIDLLFNLSPFVDFNL